MPLHDLVTAIGDRHFENVLCQIHSDGSKVQRGCYPETMTRVRNNRFY